MRFVPLWLTAFSSAVSEPQAFEIPLAKDAKAKEAMFADIRDYAGKLRAEGGTALYDAIYVAVKNMGEDQAKTNAKTKAFAYSVVVFTDGERTEGMNLATFLQRYDGLDASAKKIPVFLILFAEGEARALNEIAKATGGKVFDARKQPLASVFKEIRAYQ